MSASTKPYHIDFFKKGIKKKHLIPEHNVLCMHNGETRQYQSGRHVELSFSEHSAVVSVFYTDDDGSYQRKLTPSKNHQWDINGQRIEILAVIKNLVGKPFFYFIRHTDIGEQRDQLAFNHSIIH